MQLLSKMESEKGREAMEKTRDPAREKHDRLLRRCQESPAVQEALGNVFDACGDLIFLMVMALKDLEEEDERNKG